jgi:ribosomal protein S12 methylthiotransferase
MVPTGLAAAFRRYPAMVSGAQAMSRQVALVTLGCARNELDSEELAARLGADGWRLSDADAADVIVVNTCAFIDAAKKDSIDTLIAAAETGRRVVAVGCLAERYGNELAAALPEADAVLGFDRYPEIAARLDDLVDGRAVAAHMPRDRRRMLPVTPAARREAAQRMTVSGHGWIRAPIRQRLDDSPMAYLKLASGCDRRCTFCAIPSFRGAFVSRAPDEVVAEARWLADRGVAELVLVSENSTSYGKDLGDLRALERLLVELAAIEGIARIRVSYLQPAELRPTLVDVIASTPGIAPYFDLSFQHASASLLRRMRRFGSAESFLQLLDRIRSTEPRAGIRSNVIVGFPGETEADLAELESFLAEAGLDAIGVFGYSDEEGTEAATFSDKLAEPEIADRVARVAALTEELMAQRAEDRIGEPVAVLIEQTGAQMCGRAAHQGPDADGAVQLTGDRSPVRSGDIVPAVVVAASGVDLVAQVGAATWT